MLAQASRLPLLQKFSVNKPYFIIICIDFSKCIKLFFKKNSWSRLCPLVLCVLNERMFGRVFVLFVYCRHFGWFIKHFISQLIFFLTKKLIWRNNITVGFYEFVYNITYQISESLLFSDVAPVLIRYNVCFLFYNRHGTSEYEVYRTINAILCNNIDKFSQRYGVD